jgi:hypothetical protein
MFLKSGKTFHPLGIRCPEEEFPYKKEKELVLKKKWEEYKNRTDFAVIN